MCVQEDEEEPSDGKTLIKLQIRQSHPLDEYLCGVPKPNQNNSHSKQAVGVEWLFEGF